MNIDYIVLGSKTALNTCCYTKYIEIKDRFLTNIKSLQKEN